MRAFVDRIEDGMSVLLLGEDESIQTVLPASWLPAGAVEGTVLRVDFTIDDAATKRARDTVQSILDRLGGTP